MTRCRWWCTIRAPERVTIYEVGPRDGLQNESALVPTETKAEFVRRLVSAGLPVIESTSFVHPKWVPQLADAADLVDLLVAELGDTALDMPVLVPNERGLDRALEKGLRHVAIFGSATETFAQRNLNRSLDEQFAMFEPTVRRARDAGPRRPRLRLHVLRRPVGGPGPGRAGRRRRQAAVRPRRVPAVHRRHDRGRDGGARGRPGRGVRRCRAPDGVDRHALPRHLRTGTVQRRRRRFGAVSPRSTPRRADSAAAPTPRAPPATSPPRTWSGCSPASASSTVSTWPRWWRPRHGWPGCWADRALRRLSGHTLRHEPCGLPARRRTEDRHDVPPGSSRAQQGLAAPSTRCTTRCRCTPASSGRPSTCCRCRGVACRWTSRASGTPWPRGSAGSAARWSSPTRSSLPRSPHRSSAPWPR